MSREDYTTEAGGTQGRAYAYLLGEMGDAERLRFERDYLADEDAYAAYIAAQDELIESYLVGELAAERRERFDRHFLITEQRRARLRLIRDLDEHARSLSPPPPLTASADVGQSVEVPASSRRHESTVPLVSRLRVLLFQPRARFTFAFQAAALAALVLACLAGWRLLSVRRDTPQEQARTAPSAPPSPVQPGGANQTVTPDTAIVPPSVAEQRRQPSPPEVPETPRRRAAGASYALTLLPLSLREGNGGGVAHVLRLPHGGDGRLSLRLFFEDAGEITPVRAEVSTAEGVRMYARGGLRPRRRRGASFVTLKLSTAPLDEGDYTIKLTGPVHGDPGTVIARYAFTVTRR